MQPIEIGQAEIKQHHVRVSPRRLCDPFPCGSRFNHVVLMSPERASEEAAHLGLIFDH
jgi:hypothetical protein